MKMLNIYIKCVTCGYRWERVPKDNPYIWVCDDCEVERKGQNLNCIQTERQMEGVVI